MHKVKEREMNERDGKDARESLQRIRREPGQISNAISMASHGELQMGRVKYLMISQKK
jgi:hypothetical protein